jgi:antitoxin (DNA-binding transcriptional repressor) of toxin-antitoxin stability system
VKTISVRDLRQRWPAAESLLQTGRELVVTRDGQPVARLVRMAGAKARRPRFSVIEHRNWPRQVFGPKTVLRRVDGVLEAGRRDRR